MQLSSFTDITITHRHIFLSPHYDDVVFSCGGTLGVQVLCGLRPLVITVFGGAPATNAPLSSLATDVQRGYNLDTTRGAAGVVEARQREDATALDYLQSDYLWLDYPDAIYRGDPPYYTQLDQVIGGDIHPSDLSIDNQLAHDLLLLHERLPDAAWYAPLGIGRHVDHQIVASAADRLVQNGAKVYFYEEFPYVLKPDALDARLKELGGAFEYALVEMSEMLPVRLEAATYYASQIGANFGDIEEMNRAITNYAHGLRPVETVYLERYWMPR